MDYGIAAFLGGFFFIFAIGAIVAAVFYILNLQKTIAACSKENQAMPPSNVWLILIPLFDIYWQFHVVFKIRDSLTKEYNSRELSLDEVDSSYQFGLWMCITACLSIIPIINLFSWIANIVLLIMYWVKTATIRGKLV